jgi:hypothetical protein
MSYYLIDFTKNVNNFDFDNVVIGRKLKGDNISKYYIYYQDNLSQSPKEIYIRLPQIRTIYNLSNYKFNRVSIPIYPNYNLTNNFVKFILNFESNIKDCFINKFPKIELNSIITKKNNLNFIKAKVDDKIKITSDTDKKDITINDFQTNSQLDIVIKLSYIWNKNDTQLSLSSSIYQIKYCAPPSELDINFIDDEIKPKIINYSFSKQEHSPINNPMSSTKQLPQLPPQISLRMIPSKEDLHKAIKKLKPANIDTE